MQDKLEKIIKACKCGVHLTINNHRDLYETVEQYIKNHFQPDAKDSISENVLSEMIETNTVIELQFYPNTPIGFFKIWHYDLEEALDDAIEQLIWDGNIDEMIIWKTKTERNRKKQKKKKRG